ncbi:MAG: amino acid permease [Streptosporangiales bacterium]|nr:amino acid permease [Streptosporangiales bacterium]
MGRHATRQTDSRNSSRRLPAELAIYRADTHRHVIPRLFGRGDLVLLGLGVMIGAGIFTLAAEQAAASAGPAVIVSFLVAGLVCLLAAMSYAELSSAIPVAGSAYTFSYVIFGEFWAWLVGWALLLELVLAAAVVSRSWSEYLVATLDGFGVRLPDSIGSLLHFDSAVNVGSVVLIALLTLVVATGTRLSVRVIRAVVIAKVAVVVFIVLLGALYIHLRNYTPFIPPAKPGSGTDPGVVLEHLTGSVGHQYGLFGIFAAAGVVTFAFIGFDLIATAAEDAREPRRAVPWGMLLGVGLVTLVYLAMAIVIVGIRPYTKLATGASVSAAFAAVGLGWAAKVINVGALLALTTVVMVVLIALSRVVFAMGRDGLLPTGLSHVNRRFYSPARATVLAGCAAAVLSLYPRVGDLAEALVLGALFAFVFCSVGVLVLRRTQPRMPRGFRMPGVPQLPILAICAIGWLMLNLHVATWRNFLVWMLVGVLVYLVYGRRHSRLHRGEEPEVIPPEPGTAPGTPPGAQNPQMW